MCKAASTSTSSSNPPILEEATHEVMHCAEGGNPIDIVDEEAMLAESSFPIKPDELIKKTKDALSLLDAGNMEEVLADDFKFVAPVVGPIVADIAQSSLESADQLILPQLCLVYYPVYHQLTSLSPAGGTH